MGEVEAHIRAELTDPLHRTPRSTSAPAMLRSRQTLDISALWLFLGSTAAIQSRFYISAAFERPIHFALLTLLLTGGTCLAYSRYNGHAQSASYLCLAPAPQRTCDSRFDRVLKRVPALLLRLRPPPTPVALLSLVILARVLATWRILRFTQCSWDGAATLLPLVLALAQVLRPHTIHLPRGRFDDVSGAPRPRRSLPSLIRYMSLAVAWAWFATETAATVSQPSGAICPSGWRWTLLVPVAQLVAVLLDAFILHMVARISQDEASSYASTTLIAAASLTSAALLGASSAFWLHSAANINWVSHLDSVSVRDLLLDSTLASVALVSGIHLLSALNTWTVAVALGGISLHVQLWTRLLGAPFETGFNTRSLYGIGALTCLVLLLRYNKDVGQFYQTGDALMQKSLTSLFSILAGLLLLAHVLASRSQLDVSSHAGHAVEGSVSSARNAFKVWVSQAGSSTTLDQAVSHYTGRHGTPPPPNFDKWFEFAVARNSTIIDDFDQVHLDLRPFWGLPPSTIRERTSHLLEHPRLNMGGLRIREGEVQLSPHTPGSHRWMMDAYSNMIKPFAKWLPDMDVAFNLNDECRVAVPFEDMSSHQSAGEASRGRLERIKPKRLSGWSPAGKLSPPWSDRFLDKEGDDAVDPRQRSHHFSDHTRREIFYSHIAPSCPPTSPARKYRWWDRKTSCVSCARPHMDGSPAGTYVSNWTLAGDLCHQVDLAYLHGFLSSPAPMISTQTLFPVFSQGRVGGFADILVPSPWNFAQKSTYDDSLAIPWSQKQNGLFWRGSPSDGFAEGGSWAGFLRARFVYSALERSRERGRDSASKAGGTPGTTGLVVNVTFVKEFGKCVRGDCASERETFYGSSSNRLGNTDSNRGDDGRYPAPAPVPFSDNWKYRHLVDLDGAGFSGRFIPFMQSRSLVYRAALFRTWYDRRVHAWQHYIPLDVRLGDGLWKVLDFFGGSEGAKVGEQIALDGQDWANKVLRLEDMQVYMFRLLLEWGRLVDDRREELGFAYQS